LAVVYKVVELSMVSGEDIEACLNEWTGQGTPPVAMCASFRRSLRCKTLLY